MKELLIILMLVAVSGMAMAIGTTTFDQDVTSSLIFGDGNDNGGFTVNTNGSVELGLRGKLRHDATGQPQNIFNSNGDGTYSFAAGVALGQSYPTAIWSFEWAVNTDYTSSSGKNLNDYTYELGIDQDHSAGTFFTVFDPINDFPMADHAIGDNTTTNGNGLEATDPTNYAFLIDNNSIAQNSWKAHWSIPFINPTVSGEYSFYLAAFDGSVEVARTEITVIVGNDAVVPVPGAFLLGSLGVACVGWVKRRKSL